MRVSSNWAGRKVFLIPANLIYKTLMSLSNKRSFMTRAIYVIDIQHRPSGWGGGSTHFRHELHTVKDLIDNIAVSSHIYGGILYKIV